ncbi:MAG: hypothetical protein IJ612_06040 [Prevotella sp.]|nr:hypothetical protein [Prevotella sp.]
MKKYLFLTALSLMLVSSTALTAQPNSQAAKAVATQQADTTMTDELEAFSDTTTNDSMAVQTTTTSYHTQADLDEDDLKDLFAKALDDPSLHTTILEGLIALGVLLIIFVLAPMAILGIIFYFIYKNRKQRVRLAEEAMKNGQPIPDQLFEEQKALPATTSDLRAKGIRQTCLGVGLMIFLGNTAGEVGFGVGALVTAIGVGNLLIARSQSNKS